MFFVFSHSLLQKQARESQWLVFLGNGFWVGVIIFDKVEEEASMKHVHVP